MTFAYPFAGDYPVTLKYGDPIPTAFGGGIFNAVDFGVPSGTPILATASGVVSSAEYNYGGGNVVRIDHGDDTESAYGHLSRFIVRTGQRVQQGQIIGYSGNTGAYTTAPHLLFDIDYLGRQINPLFLLGNRTGGGGSPNTGGPSTTVEQDQGLFGIPGAIGDAAFTFGFIFFGAIILLAGVLIMRTSNA